MVPLSVAKQTNPKSDETLHRIVILFPKQGAVAVLCWSSREEIPHIQGKRNPSKMVGVVRGHQRADTLKPYSQKMSQFDHMDHSLV